jgi:hypothetical protein
MRDKLDFTIISLPRPLSSGNSDLFHKNFKPGSQICRKDMYQLSISICVPNCKVQRAFYQELLPNNSLRIFLCLGG